MCLMLYFATPSELPLRSQPELSVEEIEPGAAAVRQWFSHPMVRFIGAHGGCSCGFRSVVADEPIEYYEGMFAEHSESDDDARSAAALVALIREVATAGEVEMYPVWTGEEHLPPKGVIEVSAGQLDPETFFLNERFLYRVKATTT